MGCGWPAHHNMVQTITVTNEREVEHYQTRRHHEVVLHGRYISRFASLPTKAVRQLQLTGARQAVCLSLVNDLDNFRR